MRLINADALPRHGKRKGLIYSADVDKAPTVDAVPVIRCEHCAHKENCQWYYYSGDDYGFCSWAVREEHEQKKH